MTNNSNSAHKKKPNYKEKPLLTFQSKESNANNSNSHFFNQIKISKLNFGCPSNLRNRVQTTKMFSLEKSNEFGNVVRMKNGPIFAPFLQKNFEQESSFCQNPEKQSLIFENRPEFSDKNKFATFETNTRKKSSNFDHNSLKIKNLHMKIKNNNKINVYNLYQNPPQKIKKRNSDEFRLEQENNSQYNEINFVPLKKAKRRRKFVLDLVSKKLYENEFDQISQKFEQVIKKFKKTYSKWVEFPKQNQPNSAKKQKIDHIVDFEPIWNQPMFQNILKNTFLKMKNVDYQDQLEGSFERILEMLDKEDEVEYSIENVLLLVNLQLPINPEKFELLSVQIKLKIICFLFAKFVEKKQFFTIFSEFLGIVNLTKNTPFFYQK